MCSLAAGFLINVANFLNLYLFGLLDYPNATINNKIKRPQIVFCLTEVLPLAYPIRERKKDRLSARFLNP